MENNYIEFKDFDEAWEFLENHQLFMWDDEDYTSFGQFEIEMFKVNPETNEIDKDQTKNTKRLFYIAHIIFSDDCMCAADCFYDDEEPKIECLAESFELGIIELANIILAEDEIKEFTLKNQQTAKEPGSNIINLSQARARIKQNGNLHKIRD